MDFGRLPDNSSRRVARAALRQTPAGPQRDLWHTHDSSRQGDGDPGAQPGRAAGAGEETHAGTGD